MGECSKCGKKAMTFTCRYCGDKFCSEHRLPENHDCEGLDEKVEEEKEEAEKQWFQEKESKDEQEERTVTASKRPKRQGFLRSMWNTLRSNLTLSIIVLTSLFYIVHQAYPPLKDFLTLSPALTQSAVEATNQALQQYSQSTGQNFELPFIDKSVITAPWTLFTVMLVHGSFFHILANMVTFYFFGTAVERIASKKEMLKLYLLGGLGASVSYILFRNLLVLIHQTYLLPGLIPLSPAVGASGAVVAFVGAVAMLYPQAEVLLYFVIPMKIKTAVYAFGGMEVVNLLFKLSGYTLPVIGGFASSAHLAGLLIGLWFGRKIRDHHRQQASVFNPLGY